MSPLSSRSWELANTMDAEQENVQNMTRGTPRTVAISSVQAKRESVIMHVIGGASLALLWSSLTIAWLSLCIASKNSLIIRWRGWWGGRPSGRERKRKCIPCCCNRRETSAASLGGLKILSSIHSVLMKVMKNPRVAKSFAKWKKGLAWPWAGSGVTTTWRGGRVEAMSLACRHTGIWKLKSVVAFNSKTVSDSVIQLCLGQQLLVQPFSFFDNLLVIGCYNNFVASAMKCHRLRKYFKVLKRDLFRKFQPHVRVSENICDELPKIRPQVAVSCEYPDGSA